MMSVSGIKRQERTRESVRERERGKGSEEEIRQKPDGFSNSSPNKGIIIKAP